MGKAANAKANSGKATKAKAKTGKPSKTRQRKPKKDMNVLVVGGTLTADPKDHERFVTFDIAVHTIEPIEGEWVEVALFLGVKVYGRQARNCAKYLRKGRQVQIIGSLVVDEYELKINGKNVFRDDKEERPVMMRAPGILASDVRFS